MSLRLFQRRCAYHEASHACAALTYSVPIIRVTIDAATPHLRRGHYRQAGLGLEAIVTLCLAGPIGEQYFCGPPNDGSDEVDYQMARDYLSRRFDLLGVEAEVVRLRAAAERLVRTPSVEDRIRLIAAALLRYGTLTGDEIGAL